MKTFRQHLRKKQQSHDFCEMYDEERQLLNMALKIVDARKHSGLTQQELAQKAHITQQQLSKIEQGVNCHMLTFLKVCQALGITLDVGYISP